ncbi:HNH endonuclease [Rathayibacter sp. YIM 133350]|uniref:HNH endonuclease n=1 Tax=Rathayibacter sp. YIM 133350 TaxID=3131992 RepID=UPI00307F4F27
MPVLLAFLADPDGMAREARAIRQAFEDGIEPLPEAAEDLAEAVEGRILLARHVRRERNPKLRARKIKSVRDAGLQVACEVCGFDFEARYGARGRDYIEVHHVIPLYVSGERTTRLSDLALLCSNCHRMIHRRPWVGPAELRELLARL